MRLGTLETLARSEAAARRYLAGRAWRVSRRFCVRCRSSRVYRLADKRYRCGACGYTFQDFTARWLGQLNLKAKQWLWILKLFELEVPARRIAAEVGISYPTALKAIDLVRCAIAQSESRQSAEPASVESDFGWRGASRRARSVVTVFRVVEHGGHVEIRPARTIDAEKLTRERKFRALRVGPVLYAENADGAGGLLFWSGGRKIKTTDRSAGQGSAFWRFARERLQGVTKGKLGLYAKELEFRYNHRHVQFFELLVDYMTQLMPNPLTETSRNISLSRTFRA